MNSRRALGRLFAAGAMAGSLPRAVGAQARASTPFLPRPASLAADLARALAARRALVVMVSLHGCPYCKLVRESYLVPLAALGQPVVQVELADSLALADLRGRPSTHERVVRGFGITLAPVVLFLGRGGEEVAARLSGVSSTDFYGAYLQERVDTANRAVAT